MSFADEKAAWQQEVDAKAAELVRDGVRPHEALRRAENIVEMRRQIAASQKRRDN